MTTTHSRRYSWTEIKRLLLEAYAHFNVDKCRLMAGAMAYYALFALPILLALSFHVVGFLFGEEAAEQQFQRDIADLVGPAGASQVEIMLEGAGERTRGLGWTTVVAVVLLFYGAVRAFEQFQVALNTVWGLDIAPEHRNMRTTIKKRIFSIFFVWGIILILTASLVLSIILSAIGRAAVDELSGQVGTVVFQIADFWGSFLLMALLLMVAFKYLPDATIPWRDVRLGAVVTSFLFVNCKTVIGFFLGRSDFSSVYGAAGSMALLLVWIYCSALIVLFGAELTKTWSMRYGSRLEPTEGAARVVTQYFPE